MSNVSQNFLFAVRCIAASTLLALALTVLIAGVICSFQVGADVLQRQPSRFEFTPRVEFGLIRVVATFRVAACPKGMNRPGAHLWPKLHNADITSTGNAIATFLSALRRCVKGEY